ncbi:MAG: 4Fe-4S binding protein, partial [Fibrobacteres bacterium]|nr:4Fe-4S binding protein [Fibrobacterota bacterium]
PFAEKYAIDSFLRLDPLVAFVAVLASHTVAFSLVGALVILLLTIFLGRFFCGYICPLGTMIDFTNHLFGRKNKPANQTSYRHIKYIVLAVVVAAALAGTNLLGFFSPAAILPRAVTTVLFPALVSAANLLLDVTRPLISYAGFDSLAQLSFKQPLFISLGSLLLITAILATAVFYPRLWCRLICPTGAFLSLFSRIGIVKRVVPKVSCNECQKCSRACDMQAIDEKGRTTILSECTLCGSCSAKCESSSIKLTKLGFAGNNGTIPGSRRTFLMSAGFGLFGAVTLKNTPATAMNLEGTFIRPPGSLPESEFLGLCIRCGACMKACKTYGLQPAAFEKGFEGLQTPHLVPRIGGCEEKCNMCGFACPTGAIRELPLEEKRFVKMGTAVIDNSRCVAWAADKLCLICDEICPYDAIEFRIVTTPLSTMKRPVVLADKCTGCGLCETKCPTIGRAAIEIYSLGEERKMTGSFITPEKKKMREVKESRENSYGADAIGSYGNDTTSLPGGFSIE